ncbi:MFS transporter, partial [Rhodococcus koreensis]
DTGLKTAGRVDLFGVGLLAVGLTTPLIALHKGSTWGWSSTPTVGLSTIGVAMLVLFVFTENKISNPLVNVRALARPVVLVTNLATLLIGASMFGIFVLIPQISQLPKQSDYGFGLSAAGAGLVLLPGCIGMVIGGALAGRVVTRCSGKAALLLGTGVTSAGLALIAIDHSGLPEVIGLSSLVLFGVGMSLSAMPNLILDNTPVDERGQATGMNSLFRALGTAIGSQVVATMIAESIGKHALLSEGSAITNAFWLAAAASVVALIVALALPAKRTHHAREPGIGVDLDAEAV